MAAHFRSPLTLYVLWHPDFSDGAKLADRLFNTLSRNVKDPFVRTIGIPVYFRSKPAAPGSEAPTPIPLEESDYNAIVIFVDTNMLLSNDWKEYVKKVLAEMDADPDKTRVFPMANDFTSFQSKELGAINYIRMFEADDRDDMAGIEEEIVRVDPAAIRELESNLQAREAELQDCKARLAEKERAIQSKDTGPGVSVGVGQPAVQGNGININITINQPDSTGNTGQPTGLGRSADAVVGNAGAESTQAVDDTGEATNGVASSAAGVDQVLTQATAPRSKSAEEILQRRGNLMISKLAHELCRLIISPPQETSSGTTMSAKPVKLFLSHAKADGAEIAKQIKQYIEKDASMKTFFDANDIAPGYRFSDELVSAIGESALICIQTDYYATREWCLFEVITAKRFDRPVVVLNAVKQQEPRSFPYIGNVPTMRWDPDNRSRFRGVVDLALLEILDCTYNDMFQKALLNLHKLPGAHSVGHAPELLTILRLREEEKQREEAGSEGRTTFILYPDPPLGSEELKLLEESNPDMRFITPTMLPLVEHQSDSK